MAELEGLQQDGKTYRVVWLGKRCPSWALRPERMHEIPRGEDGSVVYDVLDTFSGPLARLVRLSVGKALGKRLGQWNEEQRVFVERSAPK